MATRRYKENFRYVEWGYTTSALEQSNIRFYAQGNSLRVSG